MSKRDLLRKANAGNAQKRGTEAVLNEETITTKTPVTKSESTKKRITEVPPVTPDIKTTVEEAIIEKVIESPKPVIPEIIVEDKIENEKPLVEVKTEKDETKASAEIEPTKITDSIETTDSSKNIISSDKITSSVSSKSSRNTKPALSENLAKYTGNKISKSIMLTAEDNKYLIKQAAAQKKPIQDIFGEVMADEIEEVKKGNIDEELAETFLKLKANNERRNVLIPEDLSIAIADTACEIPLKQGKFILYALSRKRMAK